MRCRRAVLIAFGVVLAFAVPLHACSVPVFRYALERWDPDPYEVIVFHAVPLKPNEQKLVEQLRQASVSPTSANLTVQLVDVSQPLSEEAQKVWQLEAKPELPWLVARFPGGRDKAFAGPLRQETVQGLVDSPVRREVLKRILNGESAVFLLLESGQRDKDDAACERLERQLKNLQTKLKLPEAADEIAKAILENKNAPELKLAFSVIRLAKKDESVLAEMLLNTEEDLKKYAEPMVFPIFGRGRVLEPLVGKGITDDNIHEMCAFIIGPCSCEVKRINPGRDLIMAVDWAKAVGRDREAQDTSPLQPQEDKKTSPKPATPAAAKPSEPKTVQPTAPEKDSSEPEPDEPQPLRNGLLVLTGLILVSFFVMFRR